MKPAVVRFYFDADIRGLGMLIGQLRADSTYPGDQGATVHKRIRPPCLITSSDIPDTEWIPQVTHAGYLIISRDNQTRNHVAERQSVLDHGARMVLLWPRDADTKWGQLEVLMNQWLKIKALLTHEGPFMYRASRTAFTELDI